MERAQDKRLEEIKANGTPLYSISRLDTINNCLYEAYRTYRLGDRGRNNIYAILGGKVHDVLERIVNNEATEADLLPAVESELEDMDLMGINFPKDSKGGDSIRSGWVADMEHFCKTYKSPRNKNLVTEQLFIYETTEGNVLQGYIDLQAINKDGSISIYDYKTSSLYSPSAMKEHARQLLVYAMGKQQEGYEVRNIAWIFLKYVEVRFKGKKTVRSKEKTDISKVIERRKIGAELAPYIEQDLFEAGYDELDSDFYISQVKETNSLDGLPEDIKSKYTIRPYVCTYELTDEAMKECEDYINDTIKKWESLGDDVNEYTHRPFTKTQKNGKVVNDIFYCTNLCAHFASCPHIHDFLETQNQTSEEDEFANLF